MESTDEKDKSFFDMVEEKLGKPEKFSWQAINASLKLPAEEYLYSGTFISLGTFSRIVPGTYLLTVHGLYKCKKHEVIQEPIRVPIEITGMLKINNARIRRIEHTGSGM